MSGFADFAVLECRCPVPKVLLNPWQEQFQDAQILMFKSGAVSAESASLDVAGIKGLV